MQKVFIVMRQQLTPYLEKAMGHVDCQLLHCLINSIRVRYIGYETDYGEAIGRLIGAVASR